MLCNMNAYYNEIEPYCVRWLGNLIAAGHINDGGADGRSIVGVQPQEIAATQAHFFAGIGIWSAALRAAGWPDDCEVWTGSCPCQPFSDAGSRKGTDDERHLWPEWFRLIGTHRPPVIFGEQVSSKDAIAWLDIVSADLERIGYTIRAISANAAGIGAPHRRQRLYFVAYYHGERFERVRLQLRERRPHAPGNFSTGRGATSIMAHMHEAQCEREWAISIQPAFIDAARGSTASGMGHTDGERTGGNSSSSSGSENSCAFGRFNARVLSNELIPSGSTSGHWANAQWLRCTDGKARAIEPCTFPLVDGYPERVAQLRAFGNAIVKPHAQAFIEAVIECLM